MHGGLVITGGVSIKSVADKLGKILACEKNKYSVDGAREPSGTNQVGRGQLEVTPFGWPPPPPLSRIALFCRLLRIGGLDEKDFWNKMEVIS